MTARHSESWFVFVRRFTRELQVTSAPTVSVITISFNDLDGLQRTVMKVCRHSATGDASGTS